jgi:DNA-binding beta-propeller fold protein YncE
MRRDPRTVRRYWHDVHRFTLLLVVLLSPGIVLTVEAGAAPPPPTFVGTFTSSDLCRPHGIGLSPSGDVFVGSDCTLNQHVAHYTASGGLVATWDFPRGPTGFQGPPDGVAADGSGNVFVVDYAGNAVYKYASSGSLLALWRNVGPAPGIFSGPEDVAVNAAGEVFVVELHGTRVRKFTNSGSYLMTIGSAGSGPGQFQYPFAIGLDASGRLYVVDTGGMRILRFRADGAFDMEFAAQATPNDVAVGPDGNVYLISYDGPVGQYSPSGALVQEFGPPGGLSGAMRIAISPDGAICITEANNNRVVVFQIETATRAERTSFGRLKAMYR